MWSGRVSSDLCPSVPPPPLWIIIVWWQSKLTITRIQQLMTITHWCWLLGLAYLAHPAPIKKKQRPSAHSTSFHTHSLIYSFLEDISLPLPLVLWLVMLDLQCHGSTREVAIAWSPKQLSFKRWDARVRTDNHVLRECLWHDCSTLLHDIHSHQVERLHQRAECQV